MYTGTTKFANSLPFCKTVLIIWDTGIRVQCNKYIYHSTINLVDLLLSYKHDRIACFRAALEFVYVSCVHLIFFRIHSLSANIVIVNQLSANLLYMFVLLLSIRENPSGEYIAFNNINKKHVNSTNDNNLRHLQVLYRLFPQLCTKWLMITWMMKSTHKPASIPHTLSMKMSI